MSLQDVFSNRRIMASAGTGKTWNLAARYLDLVLAGVDPATILATTFTRAAAAEIRDRVLNDAASLVLQPEVRTLAATQGRFDVGPVDEAAAARLLQAMVDGLPRLQIRTLDSLFVSLASGLGPSSGVPVAVRLADEETAADVLREAIGRAIAEVDEDEVLSTLETLGRGHAKVMVVGAIERAIVDLLAIARESTPDAWSWPASPPDREAVEAVAATLAASREGLQKRVSDAVGKICDLLEIARRRDGGVWTPILASKLVKACGPDGEGIYWGKPVPDALVEPLARVHALAVDGNLRNLARRTTCLRDVVDRVDPFRARLMREGRLASFDDFVRVLDPLRGSGPPERLAELWFRLDVAIEHLLLDEFQDTSATQLRAIRPVADEILAGGDGERPRSLLVVGDVKQSIYGWRGGDPEILERLDEVLAEGHATFDEKSLDVSYRSSRAVIDLVNAIFGSVATNPAVLSCSEGAAAHFGRLFRTHDTARKHAGEAVVEFLPDPDDDESRDTVIAAEAARAAKRLVERHGLADEDGGPSVAVLVRANKCIGRIVEALRAEGVPASGRGSGSLLDAEAAVAVVQAFRLAADPEDRLAAEDLARSPLAPLVGLDPVEGHERVGTAARRATARRLRRRFGRRGPAAVVDAWRRTLEDRLTPRESVRLRQLVEQLEIVDADPDGPRSPRRLARHLQTCRVDDPGGDGVVVMTIHQSKGLEFEGVVVTDMRAQLLHQQAFAVGSPPVPAEPIDRVSTWYDEETRPLEAATIHQDTIDRAVLESLCGLYVAITRAASDVVVQVERPAFTKKDRSPSKKSVATWGGVVRAALGRDGLEDSAEECDAPGAVETIHREGTPAADLDASGDPADAVRTRPGWVLGAAARRRRAVVAPPPSSGHGPGPIGPASVLARERGRVVHAAFELLERSGDVDGRADDAFAVEVAGRCPIDPAVLEPGTTSEDWYRAQVATVRAALESPEVRAAFDGEIVPKSFRQGTSSVVRVEWPLTMRSEHGVRIGLVDRVVLHVADDPDVRSGRRVVAASIIDFKTDRPGDGGEADLDGFRERHATQLRTYAGAIGDRYGLDPSRISISLIRVDDRKVVALSPDGG